MLLVYFVIAAIPIGYLAGGSLSNIKYSRLRLAILPCAAFLLEASFGLIDALLDAPPSEWLGKVVCLEYLLLTIFIWINHRIRGMDMLGAATLVNFIVIAANGFRMPVTPLIYDYPELSGLVERVQNGTLPEYVLVDWDGPLWFLGDTLPLGTGLASIGDLMMALGVLIIIVDLMKSEKPRKRRRRRYRDYDDRYYRERRYRDYDYDYDRRYYDDRFERRERYYNDRYDYDYRYDRDYGRRYPERQRRTRWS